MIYGIERNTDLRDRQTRIVKFRSSEKGRVAALLWATGSGKPAFPGDKRNLHKKLRSLHEIDRPINAPRKEFNDYQKGLRGHSSYQRYLEDFHAEKIEREATEIQTS